MGNRAFSKFLLVVAVADALADKVQRFLIRNDLVEDLVILLILDHILDTLLGREEREWG